MVMAQTIGNQFLNDVRIKEAKKLIREAVLDHQKKITGHKPANKDLETDYQNLLKKFGELRGAPTFYEYLGSGFGKGALVELADGSLKYDFITGIGVHYMGHSNADVIEASIDGAIANTVMNGHLQQNVDSASLAELLSTQACKNGAKVKNVFLSTSGAMACENALKIIFQKRSPACRVLAFERCFMGRTMAIANITDKAAYRAGLPEIINTDYLPFYDANDHDGSIQKAVTVMKRHIERHPGQHAALCMEVIQGENGSWPGHRDFFKAIIQVAKENNISVMIDEVQTFMRTEELFAFQYFKLDQHVDAVTIGKNSQVCATLFTDEHKPKPGLISQTFTAPSTAISSSHYIISKVLNDGYLGKDGKINQLHKHFSSRLDELHQKYPEKIEGPYGVGAMVAMTVFKGDMAKSKDFTLKLFNNGVLSFVAGTKPVRVRFLMPVLAVTHQDIDEVTKLIEKTLLEIK